MGLLTNDVPKGSEATAIQEALSPPHDPDAVSCVLYVGILESDIERLRPGYTWAIQVNIKGKEDTTYSFETLKEFEDALLEATRLRHAR